MKKMNTNNPPKAAQDFNADIDEFQSVIEKWENTPVTDDNVGELHQAITEASKLKKESEDAHRAMKEPYLKAGRAVDEEYRPVKKFFTKAVSSLKQFVADYLSEKRREAERLAREAREEEARLKREAEMSKQTGIDPVGAEKDAKEASSIAKRIDNVVKERSKVASQHGRSISLRKDWDVEITNYDDLINFYSRSDEIKQVAKRLALRDARREKGEITIPGAKVIEVQKAV